MAQLTFVMARGQNHFFVELVDVLRSELADIGVESDVVHGPFPDPEPGRAFVLVPPHEWYRLEARHGHVDTNLFPRTVFLCTEQPGSTHFDDNANLGRDAGALLDISQGSVREYRRRGLGAERFQLGYSERWDATGQESERDVDVLFMGCATDRRLEYLGAYAPLLWPWNCRLLISDNSRPNTASSAGFTTGDAKRSLLARSKVIVNLHQTEVQYFEWVRMVEALTNGCLPVSEHSTDFEPLVPGEHVVFGDPANLGYLTQRLLYDDDDRNRRAAQGRDFLRTELPLRAAVERLAEHAERVASNPVGPSRPAAAGTERAREAREPAWEPLQPGDTTDDPSFSAMKSGLKEIRLDLMDMRRRLTQERLERSLGAPPPELWVDAWSPTFRRAAPRVSVLVTLFNYADHIARALDSVAASGYRDLEMIIVDDASTDHSADEARAWIERTPGVPAALIERAVNKGLPYGRNAALAFARGEYVFVLDADNEIYPRGIDRLVEALDDDPEAVFSYGLLERFDQSGSAGLMNYQAWNPELLRVGNFIDAMALIRTDSLRELGGYTTDRRLHGWEDYALWCSIAERGGRGLLVPQFVGRYRTSRTSMLALTNISATGAYAALAERNPRLMEGLVPPL